jgi:hypothetical protein
VAAIAQFTQSNILATARGALVTIVTDGATVGGRHFFPFLACICDGNRRFLRAMALIEVERTTAIAIADAMTPIIRLFQDAGAAVVAYVTDCGANLVAAGRLLNEQVVHWPGGWMAC